METVWNKLRLHHSLLLPRDRWGHLSGDFTIAHKTRSSIRNIEPCVLHMISLGETSVMDLMTASFFFFLPPPPQMMVCTGCRRLTPRQVNSQSVHQGSAFTCLLYHSYAIPVSTNFHHTVVPWNTSEKKNVFVLLSLASCIVAVPSTHVTTILI